MDQHLAFALITAAGSLVAGLLAWLASRSPRAGVQVSVLLSGVGIFWLTFCAAVSTYFYLWKRSPNPPEEAYQDGSGLVFAMLLGWLPGLLLCGTVFVVNVRMRRRMGLDVGLPKEPAGELADRPGGEPSGPGDAVEPGEPGRPG